MTEEEKILGKANKLNSGHSYLKNFFKKGAKILTVAAIGSTLSSNVAQSQFIDFTNDPAISPLTRMITPELTNNTPILYFNSEEQVPRNISGLPSSISVGLRQHVVSGTSNRTFSAVRIRSAIDSDVMHSCVVIGPSPSRESSQDLMYNMFAFFNNEGSAYLNLPVVPRSDTLRSFIASHETAHCLHFLHPNYANDANTGNIIVDSQRREMVADFLGAALMRMNTPPDQLDDVRNELTLIQHARYMVPLANRFAPIDSLFSHYTKEAISNGWRAGENLTPRDIPNLLNQARTYAQTAAFSRLQMEVLQEGLSNLHFRLPSQLDAVTERVTRNLGYSSENGEEIYITNALIRSYGRFQVAANMSVIPELRPIVTKAYSSSRILLTQTPIERLEFGLQKLEQNNRTDLPFLRALRLDLNRRGPDWARSEMNSFIQNPQNESRLLIRNIGLLNTHLNAIALVDAQQLVPPIVVNTRNTRQSVRTRRIQEPR